MNLQVKVVTKMTTMMNFDFVWDRKLLGQGVRYFLPLTLSRTPHILVLGATGAGKTVAVKLLLGRIYNHIPLVSVTVCDFKFDDFKFLDGANNYYSFMGCTDGLNRFYEQFQARQDGSDQRRTLALLVFDEWAAYLNFLGKKEAEEAKTMLATLLMLGRSFHVHVLISQQRADAEYFAKARDNFSLVIALGNLSKESAAMFGFDRDELVQCHEVGEGHMLVNGAVQTAITVPQIRDFSKLDNAIRKLVK